MLSYIMIASRDLFSLVRPGIVSSNCLTALAGFTLAASAAGGGAGIPWEKGAAVLFGTAFLVGGACALNNWMDRDIDALMERTKDRPAARGDLGALPAIGFGLGLCLAGEAVLGLAGIVPALVGLGGALVYLLAYTAWAKRRTPLSSFVGGVAGAIPPLIGWAAVDPGLGGPALPLFGLLVIWQQAHVRALGLMREKEYARAGLPLPGLGPDAARGRRRSETALLAWTALLVPYPVLALAPLGMATVLALSGLACLWFLAGLIFRRGDWRRLMFRLSLVWLVLAFAAMIARG